LSQLRRFVFVFKPQNGLAGQSMAASDPCDQTWRYFNILATSFGWLEHYFTVKRRKMARFFVETGQDT